MENNEEKIVTLFRNISNINVSSITVGEMYYGARNSKNSKNKSCKLQRFF